MVHGKPEFFSSNGINGEKIDISDDVYKDTTIDNWAKTRVTVGPPLKDQEIISRAIKLDEFYAIEKEWRAQLYTQELAIDKLAKKQQQNEDLITKEVAKAEAKFESAYERYELKVFLFRLLFVGPILALGIFFFVRYRRHKFWPLFFGFTLFSVYAFFFGLVPYLPSYGGYVHYTVGILLSAGLGFYAIKTIRQFIETKQAELKISTTERAKNVQTAVAIKALENHFCPSCGKDFILICSLAGFNSQQIKDKYLEMYRNGKINFTDKEIKYINSYWKFFTRRNKNK